MGNCRYAWISQGFLGIDIYRIVGDIPACLIIPKRIICRHQTFLPWGCKNTSGRNLLSGLFASPEWPRLSDLLHGVDHLPRVLEHVTHIIRFHSATKVGTGKKFNHIRQRHDPFIRSRRKGGPISHMLFRPEEVHSTSGIAEVFEPFRKRNRHVPVKTQCLLI